MGKRSLTGVPKRVPHAAIIERLLEDSESKSRTFRQDHHGGCRYEVVLGHVRLTMMSRQKDGKRRHE